VTISEENASLASDNSMKKYMGKVVKRYSSLFTLPSHARIVASLFVLCLLSGIVGILSLIPSYFGFAVGSLFGIVFFSITSVSDLIIYRGFMKTDPIFNLRRCSALSLFSCLTWFGFLFLGSVIGASIKNPGVWIKLYSLGFCAAFILRLLVFSTTSFASLRRAFASSILQPALCMTPIFFMDSVIGYHLGTHLLLFLLVSIPIALLTVFLFLFFVNRVGKRSLGVASLSLFKAFMANWAENVNAPLEGFLEKFGRKQDVKVSLLAFRAKDKIKALMVIPALHPGPFKNVGSSPLPYMIQAALESKLQCVVSVPHGLSGHELDLSSQNQNQKIIEGVLNAINLSSFDSKATPFVRNQRNEASASCQIFGGCALLTLTLSPKTMEDLPQELDRIIVDEAERKGLSSAIVIDAHNSIEGRFNLNKVVENLRKAAIGSLEETLDWDWHQYPFEVGVAKVFPKEFGIKEGMGPGGISVIVVMVGDQKAAYVTIDGNNMISKLRERILSAIQEIGVVDGEILTTDTHVVNGIVPTARGYYPIGEAMDQAKLIDYIKQATACAIKDLEPAEVSWRTETVLDVKVIGEKQIETLCLLAEKTANEAKRLAISLFPISGILLTVLLLLL